MSLNLLTTQELSDMAIANLESYMNQTVPDNDKSFLRVLAVMTAMMLTGLYKYGDERAKQTLAMTASGDDLDTIGEEFDVIRKAATAAVLNITLTGTDDTIIPATATWTGDANGLTYYTSASATIVDGSATMEVTCSDTGVDGDLIADDTLTIVSTVAGLDSSATVSTVEDTGADEESDDEYRARVLFAERATTGGNNAADYKTWAEETEGVVACLPVLRKAQ